jgi:hypothetical protein
VLRDDTAAPGGPVPLSIPSRFCGPSRSANGGYVAGRLAALVGGTRPVEVTLRRPPPLDTRLDATARDGAVVLTLGDALLAEARPGQLPGEVVDPVPFDVAAAAMSAYSGLVQHPFPSCFACGTDRPAPEGLGLRPGPVPGRPDTVATTWVPAEGLAEQPGAVPPEMVWAALDCPGGWSADLAGRPMMLGRMTATVHAVPATGERCVVVGRLLGRQGRKAFTASTAYDADGRVLGHAGATWIAVDPSALDR